MANDDVATQISVFLNHIRDRRFDEETLRVLEIALVAKDVKSFLEVRSSLTYFLRLDSINIFREFSGESMDKKLRILEFFVRAFALVGDTESCLALRYEVLTLRELKGIRYGWPRVEHAEWFKFAHDSVNNGFYSVAKKACERSMVCLQRDCLTIPGSKEFPEGSEVAHQISALSDFAVTSAARRSVQAEAIKYLKNKEVKKRRLQSPPSKHPALDGSSLFRKGTKNRYDRMLVELRRKADSLSGTVETSSMPS